MPNLNKVMLMGNLTRDPEIKYTPKGTAIAAIGLAVNRNYTTESGEKREEVTFIDVEAFGKQAETIGEYCKKGRPLYVEGRLKMDTWDDKQTGQKRSKLKVILDSFQFLGSREGGGPGGGGGQVTGSDADYADSQAAESSRPSGGGGGGGGYSAPARRPPRLSPPPPRRSRSRRRPRRHPVLTDPSSPRTGSPGLSLRSSEHSHPKCWSACLRRLRTTRGLAWGRLSAEGATGGSPG